MSLSRDRRGGRTASDGESGRKRRRRETTNSVKRLEYKGLANPVLWIDTSSQNCADLPDVIGIMARHVDDQILDRNTATLSMDAKAFPLFGTDMLQKL